MSHQIDRQEAAMRYLLGSLSEDEKKLLEEEFFADDAQFEELEIAEDELIDRYVRNELSEEDTHQFESMLVSPRLSERVEVARLLAQRTIPAVQPREIIDKSEIPKKATDDPSWSKKFFAPSQILSPGLRVGFTVSLVLLLLISGVLVVVWTKWRSESKQVIAEQTERENLHRQILQQQAQNSELEAKLNQAQKEKDEQENLIAQFQQLLEKQQQQIPAVVFAQLVPGSVRGTGDGGNVVIITKDASIVNLDLDISAGDYSRYDAVLQGDAGKIISRHSHLRPLNRQGRKYIRCQVPGKLLSPGSYNVHVEGLATSGPSQNFDDYPFRVVSR